MKTAISIPDETFARAEQRAADLGMSRSEFFTRAAQRYLDQLEAESLTNQIDAAIDLVGDDDSAAIAVAAGRRRLAALEDSW
ncbi:MAG TPA: ribbon-helix-helix protein, CopG family [Micromonosporaceae bacterium]|jgi:metal-responsive CopG/Arc/MetJ family transcriptional regulator|nr:ribbon-helix-helix protein, CopG family [Micromonosporaceae bacterium]